MYDIKKVIVAPICKSHTLDGDETTTTLKFWFLLNSNTEDGTMQPQTFDKGKSPLTNESSRTLVKERGCFA